MSDSSFILEENLPELQETVEIINNLTSLNRSLDDRLAWLLNKLCYIKNEIPRLFTLDIEESQVLDHLKRLQPNVDGYYTLVKTIDDIEIALSHLLDLLENDELTSLYDWKVEMFVDLIDDCSNIATQLREWLQSRKEVIDAVLEYNEISVDHIDTLGHMIEKNIQTCFELQEVRFSSPVRHAPSFTLKQLVKVLSSYTESSEMKVPIFSNLEETICQRFLKLKHSVLPIEKSLVEILPQRIEHFSRRKVNNIEYLGFLMEESRRKLSSKHNIMVEEVTQLKIELIDKKWIILFQNLNHELTFIFEELELLQRKILEKEYEPAIQEKFKHQLRRKIRTVNKTFNAMEKAAELSLLDPVTGLETNELSRKWRKLKPVSEKILNDVTNSENGNAADAIVTQLESLKVSSEMPPVEIKAVEIPRNKFGAMLMKKMNIRPVIIAGSPASAEKINPFYETSPDREKSNSPKELVLSSVPPLPYVGNDDSFENETKKPRQQQKSLQNLENEKIQFYSRIKSRIPTCRIPTVLPVNFLQTPPSKFTQERTPRRVRGHSLRPPTPVSVLLTSGVS